MVNALWDQPEFQQKYQARLGELAEKVWHVETITNRIDAAIAKLVKASPALAEPLEKEAKRLRYQVEQQQRFLDAQFKRSRD